MAGKKKGPTKTVAKNTTKTVIEHADVPNNTAVLKEEPKEVNGLTGIDELPEPDVISKINGKTKKGKGQKNNVEVEVSDNKLVKVKSKQNNQSNGDEKKQSTSANPKKIVATNGNTRTKRKQESENQPQPASSKSSKRKSLEEQATEVKRKKTEKISDKIAVDNRIETSGIMMIKGRDIVIAGLFGLGPDREQLTNLTELKNYKFKLIAAGSMHVLGVTEDGKLMSWGCNDEGALGRDTSVEDSETRPGIVQIPEEEGAEIYSISAGGSHSAILLSNGNVYSWGTFRDKNGDMGFQPNGEKQLKPKLIMSHVKKIASGINHLVMLSKNKVYTMGCGDEGQLGRICQRHSNRDSRVGKKLLLNPQLLNLRKKVDNIWANYDTTFLRLSDSSIYSFGLNAHGQLGVENDDKCVYFPQISESLSRLKIKSISAGTQHVTLLDEQGAVYVLGDYKDGRLGMDIAENQKVPKVLSSLPQIKLATCGSDNSFVVTENNKLMAWGIGFEEKDYSDVIYYIPTDIDTANKIEQKTIVQATSSDSAVFLLLQD
ncbi:regulator of chromosome condensation-like [Metopolophium dirhodum]|uniref:regulator of chromosome condensation-like n=1 Tax=Metopolophium dirhodum TaxID=44670 RepID=UPI00298F4932|nr:regulator of chromosome condensation-like [Metopolophium dirhodum]XP_060874217.1 regulator of chromosome condensation-like [Metopolophium dirhodum]XP_060874218.1 regulator of chromosome condensation-like [Metopolophium dirhodum]